MSNDRLLVIAKIHARHDRVQPVISVLKDLAAASRREAGCLRFDLLQQASESQYFVAVEEWRSEAAVDAHMQSAHVQAALAQLDPLLVAPPRLLRYRSLM